MPWKVTQPMHERFQFIVDYQTNLYSITELCLRYHISRKTAYKWITRYHADGLDGLQERSRVPHSCPHQTSDDIVAVIRAAREAHPSWGPRKLRHWLVRHRPELAGILPAPSTIGAILDREGLIAKRRRQRHWKHPGAERLQPAAPNDVWSADFKGQFRLGDGSVCYPLTIADSYSRLLLSCTGLRSVARVGSQPVFEQVFRTYGLPQVIRTDNGTPFASTAICGLTGLSVWWLKLGIRHDRITPGRPQENGRHERMHRTLKAEATKPPQSSLAAQQERFDVFQVEYNTERPHDALAGQTPAQVYQPSLRPYPEQLPEPTYAGHMEVRFVSRAGTFRFKKRQLFISDALIHEYIALEETDDSIWSVYFYDTLLARLDERDFKLQAATP